MALSGRNVGEMLWRQLPAARCGSVMRHRVQSFFCNPQIAMVASSSARRPAPLERRSSAAFLEYSIFVKVVAPMQCIRARAALVLACCPRRGAFCFTRFDHGVIYDKDDCFASLCDFRQHALSRLRIPAIFAPANNCAMSNDNPRFLSAFPVFRRRCAVPTFEGVCYPRSPIAPDYVVRRCKIHIRRISSRPMPDRAFLLCPFRHAMVSSRLARAFGFLH